VISKQLYFLTVDNKLIEGARNERVEGSLYVASLNLPKNFEVIRRSVIIILVNAGRFTSRSYKVKIFVLKKGF
jgi:hypothetical protein